jgi:hypothetical protein
MSKQEKALRRLLSKPKDFTWAELVAIMTALGLKMEESSGSGRKFIHIKTEATLFIHEPHPAKILKQYQVRDAVYFLRTEGFIQ